MVEWLLTTMLLRYIRSLALECCNIALVNPQRMRVTVFICVCGVCVVCVCVFGLREIIKNHNRKVGDDLCPSH